MCCPQDICSLQEEIDKMNKMSIMSKKEMKDLVILLVNNCDKSIKKDFKELADTLLELISSKTISEKIKYDSLNKFIFTYLLGNVNKETHHTQITGRVDIDVENYDFKLICNSKFAYDLALLKSIIERMNKKYKVDKIDIINLIMLMLIK